VPDYNFNYA